MKSLNPDPQQFARTVLWQLCGLRAEMRVLLQTLSRQIEPDIQKADAIYAGWMEKTLATQTKFFKQALKDVWTPPPKE